MPEEPTTSRSRGPRRPLRKVTLKFEVESDPAQLAALQRLIPGSRTSGTSLVKSLTTSEPDRAIEELRHLADSLRTARKDPEGFK